MKTKVIEHEWNQTDEDGWYEEGTLVAVKRPGSTYTPPGETSTPVEGTYWDIDGTDLKIVDAEEARRYIKLLEKIIEDEESGN
jgi:hypothetical protein